MKLKTHQLLMIVKMLCRIKTLKLLKRIHRLFKQDKSYNLRKALKMIRFFIDGEKIVEHQGQFILSTFMPPIPSESAWTHAVAVENPSEPFRSQINGKRSAPISMYLCITGKCPFNCLQCSAKGRKPQKDLSTGEWKKIISGLQDMGTSIIGITGGEPMLRKDIYEIVSFIDRRSTSILFTSGYQLNSENAKKLKNAGLFGIGISLDSADPEKHNLQRRNSHAFETAVEAFKNAAQAGLYVMAQTVVLKNEVSEDNLFPFFRFAKSIGAHEVKMLEPLRSGNLLKQKPDTDIFFDNITREKLIRIQHKANQMPGMPKITSFAYTEHKNKYGCGAGNQHSYISSGGDLYPCDFVPLSFGNVTETPVAELWMKMTHQMEIPHTKCFANAYNSAIPEYSNQIPLSPKQSAEFTASRQSDEYPLFYRMMNDSSV